VFSYVYRPVGCSTGSRLQLRVEDVYLKNTRHGCLQINFRLMKSATVSGFASDAEMKTMRTNGE